MEPDIQAWSPDARAGVASSLGGGVGSSPGGVGSSPGGFSGINGLGSLPAVPKPKPGAKWNRQRAIAQSCTGWSSLMVDLHGEVTKLIAAQEDADNQMAKLKPQSQSIFQDISAFNKQLFRIFTFWNAQAPLKLDPNNDAEDANTFTFENVMDEQNKDKGVSALRESWKETAIEVSTLASWSTLSKFASTVLGVATEKVDLENKNKEGKALRKEALAFVRSVKKSATDVKVQIDKAASKEEKDKQEADRGQAQGQEAAILSASVVAPVVAVPRQLGPEVLAFFKEDFHIPEVITFKTGAPKDFCQAWVKEQHEASSLKDAELPYGISAASWLEITKGLNSVSTAFGRFMGEFLASDEYKSAIGKGSVTLSGCGTIGTTLRDIVYLPQSQVLKVSRAQINQQVANVKQQGPNRYLIVFMWLYGVF